MLSFQLSHLSSLSTPNAPSNPPASQDAPRLGKPKMLFFPFDFQELPLGPQSFTVNKTSEAQAGGAGRKPAHVGAESRSRCSLPASQGAGGIGYQVAAGPKPSLPSQDTEKSSSTTPSSCFEKQSAAFVVLFCFVFSCGLSRKGWICFPSK